MVEQVVAPLQSNDKFLRRVFFPDHHNKNTGLVHWRAFGKVDDPDPLSLTLWSDDLRSDETIENYREYHNVNGDLPGLLWFSYEGLASIELPPRRDPDLEDPVYGHLHCCTDPPRKKSQKRLLQKIINDDRELGGVLRRYEKRDTA